MAITDNLTISQWDYLNKRFPVKFVTSKAKLPIIKKWNTLEEDMLGDPSKVSFYGIQTGARNNVTIVDVDKHGKDEDAVSGVDWFNMKFPEELRNTLVVQSPSGGYHLYYNYEKEIKGHVTRCIIDSPEVEIDIRSDDAKGKSDYIMAPGSDGYTFLNFTEVANMPKKLFDLIIKRDSALTKKRKRTANTIVNAHDDPPSYAFLNRHFPEHKDCDWTVEEQEDGNVKFTPHSQLCLVSNKMHSDEQSALYLNQAHKNGVCTCFSCGSRPLDPSTFRQIHNTYNVLILNQQNEDGPYRQLVKHICDFAASKNLRRLNGNVYEPIRSHSYRFWMKPLP